MYVVYENSSLRFTSKGTNMVSKMVYVRRPVSKTVGMLGGFKNGVLGGFKNGMLVVYVKSDCRLRPKINT